MTPTGEPIIDEQGNVVRNGDGTIFVAAPLQAQVHDRRELWFDAVVFRTDAPIDVSGAVTFGLGTFDRTSFAGSLLPAVQGPAPLGPLDGVTTVVARSAFGTFVVRTTDWTFDLAQRTLTVDLSGSYEIGPRTVDVTAIGPVWLEVSAAVQAFHAAGDQQRYFGDEAVAHGQPVVDVTGNLVTVAGTGGQQIVVRWTDNPGDPGIANGTRRYVRTSRGTQILHRRGEAVYIPDATATLGFRVATHAQGDDKRRLGNEARRWFGGEQALHAATDVVESGQQYFRLDLRGALVAPIVFRNLDDVVVVTGRGNDAVAVRDTHAGETVVDTGAGDDRVDVHAVRGNTTILAGAGTDTVNVGSVPLVTDPATAADHRPAQHRPHRRARRRRRR